jgi:tetratricopeptide (TPR) repeat protein
MKGSVLLPLTVGAFLTATAFRFAMHTPIPSKTTIEKNKKEQKRLAIRCSPAYIPTADEDIPPLTGWGNYKWKITTRSDSAQFYFNQGMAMYYAFHIIESRASFDKATRFDPDCAMAWWGKALAFGPNINDFGYQRPSEAYPSATKAVSLKASCTPLEKALITAIAVRYSADSTVDQKGLNEKYRDAMANVYKQFGSNADAVALYADALMLLHPWDLYNHDYTPKAWTPQIVTTIKQALKLSLAHIGANHYYIHAVEGSAHPGDALKSAKILATAMPNVSHITHMPSHIYIRTGYYNTGIGLNTKAVEGYQKYLASFSPTAEGAPLYILHNLHMKMACAQMAGNYNEAINAAKDLQAAIPAFYLSLPGAVGNGVQYWYQSPLFTYIRFGKWDKILAEKTIDTLAFVSVLQHFGKGLAYARKNQPAEAAAELAQMQEKMQVASLKEPAVPFNSAYDAAVVAEKILEGVIAEQQNNSAQAIQHFQEAVNAEDHLIYNEPRDWLLPARHYLGNALLNAGRYNEAIAVLQQDLVINPNNGWAITGLQTAFQHLNRSGDILAAKQRLKNAWLIKDIEITKPVF